MGRVRAAGLAGAALLEEAAAVKSIDRETLAVVAANASHLATLRAMLYEAACWRPDGPHPPQDVVLAEPGLAKWVEDFGARHGDAGFVAVTPEGAEIGAAWYRFWTVEDHSYGFVAPHIPELAIGVAAGFRGMGVGRMLLTALMLEARRRGVPQLSLSVEKDNPAARLYRRLNFREAGTVQTAWTMLAEVPDIG